MSTWWTYVNDIFVFDYKVYVNICHNRVIGDRMRCCDIVTMWQFHICSERSLVKFYFWWFISFIFSTDIFVFLLRQHKGKFSIVLPQNEDDDEHFFQMLCYGSYTESDLEKLVNLMVFLMKVYINALFVASWGKTVLWFFSRCSISLYFLGNDAPQNEQSCIFCSNTPSCWRLWTIMLVLWANFLPHTSQA